MRVAVICAFNPNRNTGMCTVDRAARRFFAEFPGLRCDFLTLGALEKLDDGDPELAGIYGALQSAQGFPKAYDLIVFWGDFLHSRRYWSADLIARLQSHGIAETAEAAIETIYRLIMLEAADEATLSRVVVFGGTIAADDAEALADARYMAALKRLLRHAAMVKMRDAVSAYRVAQLVGRADAAGIDAAFLGARGAAFRGAATPGAVGFYFGRSGRREKYLFALLIWMLRRRLKAPFRWIQWLPPRRKEGLFRAMSAFAPEGPQGADRALAQLAACDFVVTDVYHVCVNAWAAGVPAVCLGHGARWDRNTIGSKKKEILFLGLQAQTLYIFWESLSLFRLSKISRAIESRVRKDDENESIFNNLKNSSEIAYNDLHKLIASRTERSLEHK